MSASETTFDYMQMKRFIARERWSKENPSPQELQTKINNSQTVFATK
jgi:hypothetical protein